jgi:hypothetical protein
VTRNIGASVRQRLLNRAHAERHPFIEVLQYYARERFLYRLGNSPYANEFVLKGALMFSIWQGLYSRPTRDIDLHGRQAQTVERIVAVIRAICQEPIETDDGLRFDPDSVIGDSIVEAANYAGVRIRLAAYLDVARIPMQIDIGFGDPIVPGPRLVQLPVLLNFPAPKVQGYSRESAIAEKFQAMAYLGEINTRMKDFHDVWSLATSFEFDGLVLSRAIRETFRWRQTTLPLKPVAFEEAFARDQNRQAQWVAFTRRHQLTHTSATLLETVQIIAVFLQPVIEALSEDRPFDQHWPSGGPWIDRK